MTEKIDPSKNTPWIICGVGTTALMGIPKGGPIEHVGSFAYEPGKPLTLEPVFELHTVRINVPTPGGGQPGGQVQLLNELKIIPFLDLLDHFPVRVVPTWIVRVAEMPPSRRESLITTLEGFAKEARARGAGLVLP